MVINGVTRKLKIESGAPKYPSRIRTMRFCVNDVCVFSVWQGKNVSTGLWVAPEIAYERSKLAQRIPMKSFATRFFGSKQTMRKYLKELNAHNIPEQAEALRQAWELFLEWGKFTGEPVIDQ